VGMGSGAVTADNLDRIALQRNGVVLAPKIGKNDD
jgi:hypothetical protein